MINQPISINDSPQEDLHPDMRPWHEAGAALGRQHGSTKPRGARKPPRTNRRRRVEELLARAAAAPHAENAAWVLDNFRLIFTAEKSSRDFSLGLKGFRTVTDPSGADSPRVCLVARSYLQACGYGFQEMELVAFLEGYQEQADLDMGEIWALRPALQLELIDRLTEADPVQWPVLLTSLKKLDEAVWREFFESVSLAHRVLARDPAGAYLSMDFDSRSRYRAELADLAKQGLCSEMATAQAAISLCEQARSASDGSRMAVRRTHVGFYLVDRGRAQLEAAVGYRPPLRTRIPRFLLRHPTEFYLIAIELITLGIVFAILYKFGAVTPAYIGLLLLALPATQAAMDFVRNLTTFLVPPRALPKLDFSEGIPEDCLTMVAVPTLLLNEAQVHDLVLDLEIRFLANRDRNLLFALLTDSPDSDCRGDQYDALVELGSRLIEGLNLRYSSKGRSPFYMLHRHRTYNQSEGRWMGWERKRGKLLDLNQLLRGTFDAFPVKVGDLSVLPEVRYVITLDSDSQLPRDSAAKLIGAIAHPLNRAVVDPARRVVVEGYGILQPRIGISVQSAARSRMAALYSGQTGFDIYTRAVSDVYQDLFGEGIFTGKGIYEVDTFCEVLDRRFPQNALLSHDLIEGAYTRVALVSDIELIDDYPSHFSAYSRRKHRWVRGDWQIMRWLRFRVPDFYGRMIPNPISLISQVKILDNLRRSLLEASLMLLLLGGWLWLPGQPKYWTIATIVMWCVPVLSVLFFALLRVPFNRRTFPAWLSDLARNLRESGLITLCSLIFLLHQALISLDAIVRSVGRVLVTRKKMLEWETAAEAEAAVRSKSTVDVYLEWTPWIALALAAGIWLLRPAALPAAAPLLALWILSRPFSSWLNRRPRPGRSGLRDEELQLMRESAERVSRFFRDWSCPSTNWLIPDSVRENGEVDLRISPTNLGMLLNARIAALHLGVMPLAEFVFQTQQTLNCVVRFTKHRGHLLNWYDTQSLEPLQPLFVSTVDSGNLAASLWTLKQAANAFASESAVKHGVTRELAKELRIIAEQCDRLVREMDFRYLYRRRTKSLSVGYDLAADQLDRSSYNLLASEARVASFVAIAKGDIPQEAWFGLGRAHTRFRGEPVLLSWTGTMFEYLMPLLWMRSYPDTIIDRSMKAAVHSQREYARSRGVPWGISESSYVAGPNSEYGYAAFGIPDLAMKREIPQGLVISPYSSFLAAVVNPSAAVTNLRQMLDFDWFGRYGFYEAISYGRSGAEAVRMWMAHHQGMSLLAIVNLLFDNPMRRYFHAEPQVLATELLLHERVPASALAEVEMAPLPASQPATA